MRVRGFWGLTCDFWAESEEKNLPGLQVTEKTEFFQRNGIVSDLTVIRSDGIAFEKQTCRSNLASASASSVGSK